MPHPTPPERDPQSLAEDLFARHLTAREQGQSPDFEALLREHPELSARLRQLQSQYSHWKTIFDRLACSAATSAATPSMVRGHGEKRLAEELREKHGELARGLRMHPRHQQNRRSGRLGGARYTG